MVKKKSVATKKVTGKKAAGSKFRAGAKSAPKTRWYIWVLLGLLLVIIGNQVYKYVATRQDVALLDRAEEKMRQLDFPGGKKGVIERYCSERSVKFGSPGKPTCGVSISLAISDSKTISNGNTDYLFASVKDTGATIKAYRKNVNRAYYNLQYFSDGLYCYIGDVLPLSSKNDPPNQSIAIYCQKEFQTKLYPIRD